MEYINLHVSVIDSAEFKGATPAQQGTFLCLLRYLCGQEDGDRINGCSRWPDRKWQAVLGVEKAIVGEECQLWSWIGEDLEVSFYPETEEKRVRSMRRGGRIGNKKRWSKQPRDRTPESPPESPPDKPGDIPGRIGNEMKGNEMKGGAPQFDEIVVPGLEEFVSACELRGVPRWYAENEHAYRSERPADRWPVGANWQAAVTRTFTRWRADGSPKECGKNGSTGKNGGGVWAIQQRLGALRDREKNHPANDQSSAWCGEPTNAEADDLEKVRRQIRECELQLAGIATPLPQPT